MWVTVCVMYMYVITSCAHLYFPVVVRFCTVLYPVLR